MQITYSKKYSIVHFDDLKPGDAFLYHGNLYLKLHKLGANAGDAVSLDNGQTLWINTYEPVEKADTEVIVK